MLWNRYCLIRVSVRYRGRAVPVGWRVIEHKSSSISFHVYEQLLRRVSRLLPINTKVRFLADRGFADTKLMDYLERNLGWHYRIHVKNDLWVLPPGKIPYQLRDLHLNLGDAMQLLRCQNNQDYPLWSGQFSCGARPSQ
jgi:hypothetical protein